MGIWNGIHPLIMGCKGESNGNLMGLRLGVVMGFFRIQISEWHRKKMVYNKMLIDSEGWICNGIEHGISLGFSGISRDLSNKTWL